ncbi:MFS transporter [Phytohabitans aurantiacus]|uniref:MFS transporter n=1 Tax=Phytohabitans aurantiacus TaxID=3016789 RepID=A0ABQ5R5Q2_9ACTN|nr:MFS transporter [Phytohabitans aurantiacus]GLI02114.1 MFS transporter [Phytohabitans aurantiacus]
MWSRSFRALWSARAVSYLGDSMGLVALLLYTQGSEGEALAVALLLLAGDCVPGLFGPFTGVVGDRFDLRRVMVACELAQGAIVLSIALTTPGLPVLLLLVALRGLAAQVFQAASRSAVPSLVDDAHLARANAALGAGTYGLEALGPLVAAALIPLVGVRGVLAVDAVTFAVSALLLTLLPRLRATETHEVARGFLAASWEGVRYMAHTPVVRAVAVGFVAVVAFNGVDDVAVVFLAKDTLGGSDSAAALVYAGVGIGLAAGYPLLTRYAGRAPAIALILAGFAVNSAGNLVTGLAWAVWAALALQVIRGLGISALDVGVNTELQRTVPPGLLSRVFGNLYGAVGLAAGFSYVFGGVLLDRTDARVTFVVAGTGGLVATVLTGLALRKRR